MVNEAVKTPNETKPITKAEKATKPKKAPKLKKASKPKKATKLREFSFHASQVPLVYA